jgi:shikimate kinase
MQRIILAGIKHSGKSTIGWELSSRLGLYFADLDDLILRDAQKYTTVRELYRDLGAEGFKNQEYVSLNHFLKVNINKSFVLSLGGGTIENPAAIELLKDGNIDSFFLDAESEVLYKRIIRGGIPPFLEGDDPLQKFEEMYYRRSKMYRNWADHQINTRNLKPKDIAGIIENHILQT